MHIRHVISESISQMFCTFVTDFIPPEVECGKCLCEKSGHVKGRGGEKYIFAVLFRKPSARYRVPSLPIQLRLRSSERTVYVRKEEMSGDIEREMDLDLVSVCSVCEIFIAPF
jgi:hypothetical protein